jgi:hypothetical protein
MMTGGAGVVIWASTGTTHAGPQRPAWPSCCTPRPLSPRSARDTWLTGPAPARSSRPAPASTSPATSSSPPGRTPWRCCWRASCSPGPGSGSPRQRSPRWSPSCSPIDCEPAVLACWASPRRRGPRVLGGGRTAVGRAVPGGRLLLRRRVDGRGPGRDSPDPAARPALTTVPRACPEEAGPPGRSQRDSLPRREGPGLELGVWSRGLAFMA